VKGEERLSFITAQRERLTILLSALDKEATNLQGMPSTPKHMASMFFDGSTSDEDASDRPKSSMSGLSTRKSEADFEKIEAESGAEEVENERRQAKRTTSSGGWLPWSWGAKADGEPVDTIMSGEEKYVDQGKSSGVDA